MNDPILICCWISHPWMIPYQGYLQLEHKWMIPIIRALQVESKANMAFCFVEYIWNKLAMILFWLFQIFMWWTHRTSVHPPSLHEVYQLLTSVGRFFLFSRNLGSRFATNFFCLGSLVVGLSLVLWWCLNPVVSVLAHFSNLRTTGSSSKPWFDSIGSKYTLPKTTYCTGTEILHQIKIEGACIQSSTTNKTE